MVPPPAEMLPGNRINTSSVRRYVWRSRLSSFKQSLLDRPDGDNNDAAVVSGHMTCSHWTEPPAELVWLRFYHPGQDKQSVCFIKTGQTLQFPPDTAAGRYMAALLPRCCVSTTTTNNQSIARRGIAPKMPFNLYSKCSLSFHQYTAAPITLDPEKIIKRSLAGT